MPEHAVREQLIRLLPPRLEAEARRVVGALGELERQLWMLANLMHSQLNRNEMPSLTVLQDWVDVSKALDGERARLLVQAETLLVDAERAGMTAEFAASLRERIQPFVDDVAEAQRYFRGAAQRAASLPRARESVAG